MSSRPDNVVDLPAHELTRTRICREPGCDQDVVGGVRGLQAVYCQRHVSERARAARTARSAEQAPASASTSTRLRDLARLATAVDTAAAAAGKQLEQALDARRRHEQLQRDLAQQLRALADELGDQLAAGRE